MFSIGDRAIDKRGRIFKIEETMDKDFGDGPAPYFVMTPCFPYDFNQGYQCFIPVDKADSLLRPLLTRKEAEALLAEIKDIPVLRDIGPPRAKGALPKYHRFGRPPRHPPSHRDSHRLSRGKEEPEQAFLGLRQPSFENIDVSLQRRDVHRLRHASGKSRALHRRKAERHSSPDVTEPIPQVVPKGRPFLSSPFA